jgi:nucleoside-diphosphate-sugar epimerase
VGLPLARRLKEAGHEVHGVKRSSEDVQSLSNAGIKLIILDVSDAKALSSLEPHYNWVVYCVATSGGDIESYRRVYLQGMQNVLAWLAPAPPQKFIYTSSTSVYGQTDGSVVTEQSDTKPAEETSRVLLETEKALLDWARRSPVAADVRRRTTDARTLETDNKTEGEARSCATVLRLAGIYGPNRGHYLKQFLSGRPVTGPSDRIVNMIHRDDAVGCIEAVLNHPAPAEIYNVVDDEPVTLNAMFAWLTRQTGRAAPEILDAADSPQRKRGATNKRVSNALLRQELGYKFKYPTFREGFADQLAGSQPK